MNRRAVTLAIAAVLLTAGLALTGMGMRNGTRITGSAIETVRRNGFTLDDGMLAKIASEFGIDDVTKLSVTELLLTMGMGTYDFETGGWEPISRQIYAFDAEVFDISRMYTLFLKGVDAIVPDIGITEIREDLSGMTEEMTPLPGSAYLLTDGLRSVSFRCNGHPYSVTLTSQGDWFNAEMCDFMDRVLEQEGCPHQLWQVSNQMAAPQYEILVYGTREDASRVYGMLWVR